MKKHCAKIVLLLASFVLFFSFMLTSSAAADTRACVGESVEVVSFSELKSALENFTSGANVILKGNISVTDNSSDCSINITDYGTVTLDLNGYNLTVNSKATKYLFNITGQTNLYFINSQSDRGVVCFNTTKPEAALLRVYHTYAEIHNINADFSMGNTYGITTDSSDTAIFLVDRATEVNVYSGILHNEMTNGNGVCISATDRNKQKLSFRIGGYTEIETNKYAVTFDPSYVKYVKFGSVRLESLNSNKSLYERIHVPSTSAVTLSDLWYTSEAGSTSAIYIGGTVVLNQNQKLTGIKKADISVDKTCDTLSNTSDRILLQCAGGHVRICGTCYMAYNGLDSHTNERQIGQSATCTLDGKTTGERCKVCKYTTSKTIPKTGHSISYVPAKAASCGVDGMKAHYYCSSCKSYFSDSAGKTSVSKSSLIIANNHVIEHQSAVPATCTSSGLTAGIRCKTCGKVTLKQEVVPAKGHDYPDSWYVKSFPNCQKEGINIKICRNCGNTLEQTTAKTGHSDSNSDGKCDYCSKELTVFDPIEPDKTTVTDCSCGCHAKGIKNFFFKIGLFFQRIFRANKECKCGIAHY